MKTSEKLVIESCFKSLINVREFIRQKTGMLSLSEKETFAVVIATDEICSNIIRHAYKEKKEKQSKILITISREDNVFHVSLEHSGIGYDINMHPSLNKQFILDKRPKGGYGINIARSFVDSIEYTRNKNRVIITLKKILACEKT